jgi:hypothetical protein
LYLGNLNIGDRFYYDNHKYIVVESVDPESDMKHGVIEVYKTTGERCWLDAGIEVDMEED